MSNSKSAISLTKEWFDRVWNQGDQTAIHEMMCTGCRVLGLKTKDGEAMGIGPEEFAGIHEVFMSSFDNIHVEIIENHEDKDKNIAIGHARFTGKHKKTGKLVNFIFSFSGEWVNDKVTNARNVIDFATLLTQIGAIHEEAIFEALG